MPAVDVGPGWVLLMAGLYYVNPLGCFWPMAAAMACHELGHWAALRLSGVPVRRLRLGMAGAVLETGPMDYRQQLVCALAGPAANVLLLPVGRRFPAFGAVCLVLALFNLLPVPPLDGSRALEAVLLPRLGAVRGRRALNALGAMTAVCLAGAALYAATALGSGPWPVLAAGLTLLRLAGGKPLLTLDKPRCRRYNMGRTKEKRGQPWTDRWSGS